VTEVETALERQLSAVLMRGRRKPRIVKLPADATLVEQGEPGSDLFLLLDGVLRAEVDGEPVAELGPGALLGERALLEHGTRTSTLRSVTPCTVAVAGADDIDRTALEALSEGHRREDAAT
jgi:CRP-like cAMP-binding protein